MIKSIKAILAQDKEKFKVPRKVQDLIPIKNIRVLCKTRFKESILRSNSKSSASMINWSV